MKRLVFAVLSGALLLPRAVAAQPVPSAAPSAVTSAQPAGTTAPVRATLANGMRVVILPNSLAPVATTLISYGVGSVDDTMPGIAHATEHMLFRGTKALSGGQLADVAARIGASYNARTGDQTTLYYYKFPSAYIDVVLRIEADRMTGATIRDEDWATERGAIEQEIRAQESQPIHRINVKLRERFFAGTPFATASGGTVPSFEKMTAADIRAFYQAWYKPSNATLVVAGDVDAQRVLGEIRRRFEIIPDGTLPAHKPTDAAPLASSTVEDTVDFPIGFGALAYRLPGSNDPDFAATQVLAAVFSSGRGALAELSAEGKTLAAMSLVSSFPEVGAAFFVAVPAGGRTAQDATGLVQGVLADYRKNGVPPELIDVAKTRLLAEQSYRQSSITGLGVAWSDAQALHQASPDAVYDAVAKVTPADVDRVLQTYIVPEHEFSMVISPKPSSTTPKTDRSAGIERLGFTPTMHEPLPGWAQTALKAPLHAPGESTTRRHTLPNGMRYWTRRETAAPTVVLSGVVRTSPLLYVPKGKDGLATILDGLFVWGTTTYDRKAYQSQFDAIAATGTLGTTFSLRVQSKDFERGVELIADGMLHPAFPPQAFKVVKDDVRQVVVAADKLPKTKADLAQRLALYAPGDPRRRDTTQRTVDAVTLDDTKRYYRFAFRPDETFIAVVGDVAPDRVERAVRTYFGAWKATGPPPSFQYARPRPQAAKAQTVTVKSSASVQSEVTLKSVFAMRRGDPDYVPLILANTMLSGEGSGSMLSEELRTHRGYVYSVDSAFKVDGTGAEFTVSFASDPKNVRRTNAAVVGMIKRMQAQPLALVDLQRAKAMLFAQRVLPLDSYAGLAGDLLSGAAEGYDGGTAWFWDALLKTTPAQVQHAVRRIDADHFLRVIVQPGS